VKSFWWGASLRLEPHPQELKIGPVLFAMDGKLARPAIHQIVHHPFICLFVGVKPINTPPDRRTPEKLAQSLLETQPVFQGVGRDEPPAHCLSRRTLQIDDRLHVGYPKPTFPAGKDTVAPACGADIDYGQIVKEYIAPSETERRKHSPSHLKSVHREAVNGEPVAKLVSTSMIERANLTGRTHCKRFARLTHFSKKRENFEAAIDLHLAYYNFVKFHGTVRMTPAMAAGIEKSPLTVKDLIDAF
jgi:hypothetical protein